jgi:hypothetical protein
VALLNIITVQSESDIINETAVRDQVFKALSVTISRPFRDLIREPESGHPFITSRNY